MERKKTRELRDRIKEREDEAIEANTKHRQEIGAMRLTIERRESEFKRLASAEEEIVRQNTELRQEVEALKKVFMV